MNSTLINSFTNFFTLLITKVKESVFYCSVKKIDIFVRRLIRNSFSLSLFSSEDTFDSSYKTRISDKILAFKNKFVNKTGFVRKVISESYLNKFMENLTREFTYIKVEYYGVTFSLIGIFSVLRCIFVERSTVYFLISVFLVIFGVVMMHQQKNLTNLIKDSFFLRKTFGNFFNKEDEFTPDYKKTSAFTIGIILGFLVLCFGIIPVFFMVAAFSFIYFSLAKSFLVALLVAILLPFLPTMVLVALSLATLCVLLYKKLFAFPTESDNSHTVMNFAVSVYMVSLVFGTVFSYTPVASLKIALVYVAFVLFYYVITKSVKTIKQVTYTVYGIVIASVPVSLYGIIQKFVGFEEQSKWHDENMFGDIGGRVVSFFENPNVFGEYLIWLIIISISAYAVTQNKKLKVLLAVAVATATISMVFTYSRGCWIGVLIALAIYLFLTNRKVFWLFAFCGVISIFFLPDSIISRIASVGDMSDTSTSYRVYIWKGTFEMLKDYWFTGIGLGSSAFNEVYPVYAYSAISAPHPHNLYLLIVSETGIIGVIGFVFVIFVYYKNMIKSYIYSQNRKVKVFSAAFIAAMTGYLIQGLFDNVWYNYRIYMLFWIFIALGTSLYLNSREEYKNDQNC